MNKTGIDYLDLTWNPIAMRCTPVSEACAHCWHLKLADRFSKNPNFPPEVRAAYAGEGPPVLLESRLYEPLHKRGSHRIGVQFMGDLWHPNIPLVFQAAIFKVVHACPQHTFLFLTKRTDVLSMFDRACGFPTDSNIWLGVTAENQKRADERIPTLLQIPAAKQFVSIEPMLGAIDLTQVRIGLFYPNGGLDPEPYTINALQDTYIFGDEGDCAFSKLDLVIAGGETGPKARPMHPDWVRSLRDQCQTAGTPFFFKNFGEWREFGSEIDAPVNVTNLQQHTFDDGCWMVRVGKKTAGRLLDGELWDQYPED